MLSGVEDGAPAIWVQTYGRTGGANDPNERGGAYLVIADELAPILGDSVEPTVRYFEDYGSSWVSAALLTTDPDGPEHAVDFYSMGDGRSWPDGHYLFDREPPDETPLTDADIVITGSSPIVHFDDIDSDGLSDALATPTPGAVSLLLSPFSSWVDASTDGDAILQYEQGGTCGVPWNLEDVDGDGYADALMHCSFDSVETVGVLLGPLVERDGLDDPDIRFAAPDATSRLALNWTVGGAGTLDMLGISPAGDLTGDGSPDIAVNSSLDNDQPGPVYILDSFEPGVWPIDAASAKLMPPEAYDGEVGLLGVTLVADLDGDAQDDIVVDVGANSDAPRDRFYVVPGPVAGDVVLDDVPVQVLMEGADDRNDSRGAWTVLDIDGDGRDELAIQATEGYTSEPAVVYLFHGCEAW
jgi:hypothetical protein